MRTLNSLKNMLFGMISQVCIILIGFLSRSIFINYFGIEYLGINGLFSNILNILSFSELGFGTVALYSLYKPLAEKNHNKVAGLMKLYKKIYTLIFLFITIGGIACSPFITSLIKEVPDIPNIQLIFILFALNSSISYLYSYKRSLLFADQKNFIVSIVAIAFKICTFIFNTLVIIVFKNYLIYLISCIVLQFSENLVISLYVDKNYSYINHPSPKLDEYSKIELITKTKAAIFRKIGFIFVTSTDNLLISKYIGLNLLGKYSNYTMIVGYLSTFVSIIFSSMAGSVGNFSATKSNKEKEELFKSIFLMNYFIYGLISIGLYNTFNKFIYMWIGSEYLLSNATVFVICLNFYIHGMRRTTEMFNEANGNLEPAKYFPLIEAALNLFLSIYLIQKYEIIGVLLGTIISMLILPCIVEPYIFYKHVLNKSPLNYYVTYIKYFIITLFIGVICNFAINYFYIENAFLSFIIAGLVSVLLFCISFAIFFFNNKDFSFIKSRLAMIISKSRKG